MVVFEEELIKRGLFIHLEQDVGPAKIMRENFLFMQIGDNANQEMFGM